MTVSEGMGRVTEELAALAKGPVGEYEPADAEVLEASRARPAVLGDGRVKSRPDFVGLEMCGVRLGYTNGTKGVHALVTIKS